MTRVLFWLLLAFNLLFFAYMQWGSALLFGDNVDLQVQPPLNAGKIRLLSMSAPVPAAAAPKVSAPAAAPVQAKPAPVQNNACMEWGEFSGDDLAHASTALTALNLGKQLTRREVEQSSGYWVYMPSQHSHARALKKVSELKALGVTDYFIKMSPGKWQYSISLGIFRTQAAAQNHLAELRKKGVHSARITERQAELKFTLFVIRNPDTALTAKMVALQKTIPGSELKAVACD